MNIKSYSREQIEAGLNSAKNKDYDGSVKILFSPVRITDENFEQVCEVYAPIRNHNFETVIILEGTEKELTKKISLPSTNSFETHLGEVFVNDKLRNEFCDEEDDFYVDDNGYHDEMSLFDQLVMLQCTMKSVNVVSMQISNNERTSIIRELASVLSDILSSRNALIIICTEMANDQPEASQKIKQHYKEKADSNLKNVINSFSVSIKGKSALMTGLLAAEKWDLYLTFINNEFTKKPGTSLIAGFGSLNRN